ncbi:MAG: FAD-binding dehydrogenase [Chloroflexi bacterium]|nr:MAG: FAD-binding dehydrogenase [Chloroflexota bacterium]
MDADAIVVGAGLAGLVATAELAAAKKRVILLEQEPEASLGGQAFWSFGGLFMVDTPEQRRLGVRDSRDLALRDWLAYAGFDRDEDAWPRKWAEAYVDFAAGEMRLWLHRLEASGAVSVRHRHRVTSLIVTTGTVDGVGGEILAPSSAARGEKSAREVIGELRLRAPAVVVTSGGIGGDHDLVRRYWPERLGTPPAKMLSGVPDHVDGRMLEVARSAGARFINADRMWNYPEGVENYAPIWSRHGIRILPGPTPLWLDGRGGRLPAPIFPGFDALAALEYIARSGHDHSWFVMDSKVFGRELALSGSEQNPDLTGKSVLGVVRRAMPRAVKPVERFGERGRDFVFAPNIRELAAKMNGLAGADEIDGVSLEREIAALDEQAASSAPSDAQLAAIREARRYLSDRLIRVARPHRMLDPKAGPLVAVRLWILTRKTLGGIETDLEGRALGGDGRPIPGLFAAGEVAGFGGGGVHGYRSLEGTFLGGCIFSGRVAGRAAASLAA